MTIEGEIAAKPPRKTAKRYYVVSADSEKGPYTLAQLRASVAETALNGATLVRADGETDTQPLGPLLSLARREASSGTRSRPRRSGKRSSIDLDNAYAPPTDEDDDDEDDDEDDDPALRARRDRRGGSFGVGLAIGFLGGCIALAFSRNAREETRKGIYAGFGLGVVVAILMRLAVGAH